MATQTSGAYRAHYAQALRAERQRGLTVLPQAAILAEVQRLASEAARGLATGGPATRGLAAGGLATRGLVAGGPAARGLVAGGPAARGRAAQK